MEIDAIGGNGTSFAQGPRTLAQFLSVALEQEVRAKKCGALFGQFGMDRLLRRAIASRVVLLFLAEAKPQWHVHTV